MKTPIQHPQRGSGLDAPEAGGFTRLVLIRHGEVHARHRGTVYGRLDVELSETGLEQSAAIATALRDIELNAVVSSGLRRAEAAASLLRRDRPGIDRCDDERLLEIDRGSWAGESLAEVELREPAAFQAWVLARGATGSPGGETPEDVQSRVLPAFSDWSSRHPGGAVAIVAHLWVVRSAAAFALGIPMARSGAIGLQPGGIVELDWPSDPARADLRPRLVRFAR